MEGVEMVKSNSVTDKLGII